MKPHARPLRLVGSVLALAVFVAACGSQSARRLRGSACAGIARDREIQRGHRSWGDPGATVDLWDGIIEEKPQTGDHRLSVSTPGWDPRIGDRVLLGPVISSSQRVAASGESLSMLWRITAGWRHSHLARASCYCGGLALSQLTHRLRRPYSRKITMKSLPPPSVVSKSAC